MRLDLGTGRMGGMLVMASDNPHMFKPGQGTDLLAFFAGIFERQCGAGWHERAACLAQRGAARCAANLAWRATALEGASEHTVAAYAHDVGQFLGFLAGHLGGAGGLGQIGQLGQSDMRAWMAQERAGGIGSRTLARKLSAVKSFARWLAEREGFDISAILAMRAPKYARTLPRPLNEQAARDVIALVPLQTRTDWEGLRDAAVVTLLYGCGLRISEALALTTSALPLGESLRIHGKGGRERDVPLAASGARGCRRLSARLPAYDAPRQRAVSRQRGAGR
jgi:integrase/recombinase XerC